MTEKMRIEELNLEEYTKLWEKMKGSMRFDRIVERYPWDTDEQYKARCSAYYNPEMPSSVRYWDEDGEKILKLKVIK